MFNLSKSICRRLTTKDSSSALAPLFCRWLTKSSPSSQENLGTKVKRVLEPGSGSHLYSYILASHDVDIGSVVMNLDQSNLSTSASHGILDPNSHVGNCLPLANMRMGTWVHDVECRPGQGAKLARAAGTFAKVVKEPGEKCLLRLPSGEEKLVDSRCRATVGVGSNPKHKVRKYSKAGNSRWLGRRPVVRGVAMNPVDHPHGGGEGRTKGGRPSVTPWGKPTKCGYRTVIRKKAH